ncbi:MAG: L,D-transpeptidase [Rhodobacterales bacterium]|nr:L,D-transpeptidase [Rhodobacterales bacterium]
MAEKVQRDRRSSLRLSVTPLAVLGLTLLLTACGAPPEPVEPPPVPGYEGVQDGDYFIEPVPPQLLDAAKQRTEVDYAAGDEPGSVVVDPYARRLYYVLEGGRAIRYAVGVGREGSTFRGTGTVGRKAEWPGWTPTANMIRRQPDVYGPYAGGIPGGLESPLGPRALYLYRGSRDTYFRIHGTVDPRSIGRASSAGCIRLFNQDIIDLYNRVEPGARVKVRTAEESQLHEGLFIDDEDGDILPAPPGYVPPDPAADPLAAAAAPPPAAG